MGEGWDKHDQQSRNGKNHNQAVEHPQHCTKAQSFALNIHLPQAFGNRLDFARFHICYRCFGFFSLSILYHQPLIPSTK